MIRQTKRAVRAILPRCVRRQLLCYLYRGDQRYCPCCGGGFRVFWPSGVNNKPDTMCPNCGSLERHRLLWLFLQSRPHLFVDPVRLLHVAPEPLFEDYLKQKAGVDYLSADLGSPGAMVTMDITDIAYPDASFDAVVCAHVLEHIPDDVCAMRELYRVLAPGGWAILQAPVDNDREVTYEDSQIVMPVDRLREFGQEDHVRVYGRDYESRLRAAGFVVDICRLQVSLGAELTVRYGLQAEEDVYYCTKEMRGS